jgi:hypothetical protein
MLQLVPAAKQAGTSPYQIRARAHHAQPANTTARPGKSHVYTVFSDSFLHQRGLSAAPSAPRGSSRTPRARRRATTASQARICQRLEQTAVSTVSPVLLANTAAREPPTARRAQPVSTKILQGRFHASTAALAITLALGRRSASRAQLGHSRTHLQQLNARTAPLDIISSWLDKIIVPYAQRATTAPGARQTARRAPVVPTSQCSARRRLTSASCAFQATGRTQPALTSAWRAPWRHTSRTTDHRTRTSACSASTHTSPTTARPSARAAH